MIKKPPHKKCEVAELYLLTHCKLDKVRVFCEFEKIIFQLILKKDVIMPLWHYKIHISDFLASFLACFDKYGIKKILVLVLLYKGCTAY